MLPTLEWTDEGLRLLDQRLLPGRVEYRLCRYYEEVAEAIRAMVVRGAPAIGVTAAMGVALGMRAAVGRLHGEQELRAEFERISARLFQTRPTAVNLRWALARMRGVFEAELAAGGEGERARLAQRLIEEARAICEQDIACNRRLGANGAALMPDAGCVLTHCNAGALATAGYGTALGVIRAAIAAGKRLEVYADETRPFLQGARLTAWELQQDGIPTRLITDNMAGYFLRLGRIQAVVVGADRIAANGDTANKIGTYSVAVLAKENQVPFYVAAPVSTLDLSLVDGDGIPIEERAPEEVTHLQGQLIAPAGMAAANPAFDITPHRYISAIITEAGVAHPPYTDSLRRLTGEPVGTTV